MTDAASSTAPSKSIRRLLRRADRLPADWEIDYEDLGNVYGRARIQSIYGRSKRVPASI